jgi:hypothetical protein
MKYRGYILTENRSGSWTARKGQTVFTCPTQDAVEEAIDDYERRRKQ